MPKHNRRSYLSHNLAQVSPHLHQGTWFGLRNVVTSSLVLIAAYKAQNAPNLPLVHELVLPEGWRRIISNAFGMLSPYWNVSGSGGAEMRRVLQSALDDVDQG
jgi:hypothetical protein